MDDLDIFGMMVGKKIKRMWKEGLDGYDDVPFIFIELDDGSIFKITSYYWGYTGKSEDEYQRLIGLERVK